MGKLRIWLIVAVLATGSSAFAGAIFTNNSDGSIVNGNIYDSCDEVYLSGGPPPNAPASAAGLPDGVYVFQVTDPPGKELLSKDIARKRRFRVEGGIIVEYLGTTHLTGASIDHDAISICLWPFKATPNSGGVHKAWATPLEAFLAAGGDLDKIKQKDTDGVFGFVHSESKTDNFKCDKGPPPPIIRVKKFEDLNADGDWDAGEPQIAGWEIIVTDPLGMVNTYYTLANAPVEFIAVPAGSWLVTEEIPEGWFQTAAYLDGVPQSVSPTVSVTVAGNNNEVHEVVFGNVELGDIVACKWYDLNRNGEWDEGEPPISSWALSLSGTNCRGEAIGPLEAQTGADGCVTWEDLLPGSYVVSESIPAVYEWTPTTPTFIELQLESGEEEYAEFGNFCVATVGFNTKGYWHNKNGLAEITDADIAYANSLLPYSSPSSYFGEGDEPFDGFFTNGDPVAAAYNNDKLTDGIAAGAGTARAEISHFLTDSNAGGDPREQLAQQLLALIQNLRHRAGGLGVAIWIDGGWKSGSEIIAEAIQVWKTGTGVQQTSMQGLITSLNESTSVKLVSATPCPVN